MDENRRRRRRRRRLIASALFLAFALTLAWIFESQATTTVLFTRYAEVTDPAAPNPGLSVAGQKRAVELARFVGDVDVIAGVDAIFATTKRSTQETARPLAERLQIEIQTVDSGNVEGLEQLILNEYKGRIVLVVTDREAIPALIESFHGSKHLPPMADGEHDNFYVVSIPWYGKVKTLRFRYGAPYIP